MTGQINDRRVLFELTPDSRELHRYDIELAKYLIAVGPSIEPQLAVKIAVD